MIRVLVVDDDPMVADINQGYIQMISGFQCVGVASRGEEAIDALETQDIDLVLLDIFMPGVSGLEILREIRRIRQSVDVIVISAASDIDSIQVALRLGAVDYLIKPFEFARFQTALEAYAKEHHILQQRQHLSQQDLDQWLLRKAATSSTSSAPELPKGITKATLERVVNHIDNINGQPFTTEEVASLVGISRVSMRKYLYFLEEIAFLTSELEYRSVGRPILSYQVNRAYRDALIPYLQ